MTQFEVNLDLHEASLELEFKDDQVNNEWFK